MAATVRQVGSSSEYALLVQEVGGGAGSGLTDDELRATPVPVDAGPLDAGEAHIGQVGGHAAIIDVTLTLDTAIYASGDVLAATQEVPNVVRVNGGTALLDLVSLRDEDDQGLALDLLFFDQDTDIGAENAAFDLTDAESRNLLGWVRFVAGDYEDWGGWRNATIKRGDAAFKASVLKPSSGATRSIWIAAITRATPTHTASGIRLRLHVLPD